MSNNIIYTPNLINEEYLAAYSPLPINFSFEEIRPFITIAESLWIVDILGKKLYNQLLEQVENNEVTPENSSLLLKIYPYLAVATTYEALPFIAYHMSDKGITKGKSDNSESINGTELSNIQNHMRAELDVLKKQLINFLREHKDCYPLYADTNCDCSVDYSCVSAFLDTSEKRNYYKQLLQSNRNSRLFSNNR